MKNPPRFFLNTPLEVHQYVELPEAVARHAGLALRLRSEDCVCLFNNMGGQYLGTLYFENKKAFVRLTEFDPIERENTKEITLIQGIASNDKMDWIIEKAVEMGVQRLIPVSADRSTVQLKEDRAIKRLQRWENIIVSASEQCGRNRLMKLEPVQSFKEALQNNPLDVPILLADPKSTQTIKDFAHHSHITLCIGPEGGWSEKEHEIARTKAHFVQVGTRILRTETAGIAICSLLLSNELGA